ncbi:unnamed protein product, partial [Symbiodinium sp. KB8]
MNSISSRNVLCKVSFFRAGRSGWLAGGIERHRHGKALCLRFLRQLTACRSGKRAKAEAKAACPSHCLPNMACHQRTCSSPSGDWAFVPFAVRTSFAAYAQRRPREAPREILASQAAPGTRSKAYSDPPEVAGLKADPSANELRSPEPQGCPGRAWQAPLELMEVKEEHGASKPRQLGQRPPTLSSSVAAEFSRTLPLVKPYRSRPGVEELESRGPATSRKAPMPPPAPGAAGLGEDRPSPTRGNRVKVIPAKYGAPLAAPPPAVSAVAPPEPDFRKAASPGPVPQLRPLAPPSPGPASGPAAPTVVAPTAPSFAKQRATGIPGQRPELRPRPVKPGMLEPKLESTESLWQPSFGVAELMPGSLSVKTQSDELWESEQNSQR